jgi:hypothetical protein
VGSPRPGPDLRGGRGADDLPRGEAQAGRARAVHHRRRRAALRCASAGQCRAVTRDHRLDAAALGAVRHDDRRPRLGRGSRARGRAPPATMRGRRVRLRCPRPG